jgi:ABC-type polysaccharide/polyol phosphate export permease
MLLGWHDILQRYRRSLLGPFWLTASMPTMVASFGFLYAAPFKITIRKFLPSLAWVYWFGISYRAFFAKAVRCLSVQKMILQAYVGANAAISPVLAGERKEILPGSVSPQLTGR